MTNGENGPRPRVYGNRELAQTFLSCRMEFSKIPGNSILGLDQFAFALILDTDCLIAKEIISSISQRALREHLGLNGYGEANLNPECLQAELVTQINQFLALPQDVQSAISGDPRNNLTCLNPRLNLIWQNL